MHSAKTIVDESIKIQPIFIFYPFKLVCFWGVRSIRAANRF